MKIYSLLDARNNLPTRKKNSNKSDFGKLLIIAGSSGSWGAGILSCRAALKLGCGYVYWTSFDNPSKSLHKIPEVLMPNFSDLKNFDVFDAILIGPGLGVHRNTKALLQKLCIHKNVIVDADALTVLSKMKLKIPSTWILTPHPGEMARLLKTTTKKIQDHRKKSLEIAQKKYGCTVLLKGYQSLISNGKITKIKSGNNALSKAGSGDVLSGMIASLCAQKMNPKKATELASFIHGYTADLWVRKYTSHSLNPSDVIDLLPSTIAIIQNSK